MNTVRPRGKIDAFTIAHMKRWAAHTFRQDLDPDARCAAVLVWLMELSPNDREYYLDRGWPTIFEAAGQR